MNRMNCPTSACQFCRHYQLEGRRGGMCQQLGVPVKAGWKACSLALPPFAPSWESFEQIWQDQRLKFKAEKVAVNCLQECSQPAHAIEKSPSMSETLAAEVALV